MTFYNERRLHSSLRYMPPREFYTLYLGEHLEKNKYKNVKLRKT